MGEERSTSWSDYLPMASAGQARPNVAAPLNGRCAEARLGANAMGDTAILVGLILLIWFLVIPGLYIFWGRRMAAVRQKAAASRNARLRFVVAQPEEQSLDEVSDDVAEPQPRPTAVP